MRISIRYQILALVGAVLLGAMAIYLYQATSLFARDKLATLYDVDSLLAQGLSEEVHAAISGIVEKLLYFAQLQPGPDADAPARQVLATDPNVLAVELWKKKGASYQRTYRYVDKERLASLNLSASDLDEAARQYPPAIDAIAAQKVHLANASLPPDLGLLRVGASDPSGQTVVIAELRPDRLLRLFGRSDLYRAWLVDARGDVLVHPDPKKVLGHANLSALPTVQRALGGKLERGTGEHTGEDGTMVASFARVDPGRIAVVVEAPKARALEASRELNRKSILFGVLVMFIALLLSIFFSRRLTAPLGSMVQSMARLSSGELGVAMPVRSRNEFGTLAEAFNQMSRELSDREAKLLEANAQLVQSEKLSALGELSAGIVHEVKNPMVGIYGFAQLGQTVTDTKELHEFFKLIESNASRANEILQNLLEFARPKNVRFEDLDANQVVEGAIRLVQHQLQMAGVQLERRLATPAPRLKGNENQLRQVLLNLFMNASHAMAGAAERRLSVATSARGEKEVLIEVTDTGMGMTEEVREKLFRPFFTTKPEGKGTGLGLSVSQRIIAQHRGQIRVESAPGKGSTFFITLPAGAPPPAA